MTTNDPNDQRAHALAEEGGEADAKFRAALSELLGIAFNFGPGSQQAWMVTLRKCSELRDHLWYVHHRDDQENP